MKLPKSWTTVTKTSKFLALVIFTTFPIFGFWLGTVYQKAVDQNQMQINAILTNQSSTLNPQITPRPTLSATR